MIESFIAFIVSNFLSFAGLATIVDNCFIYVPHLNHTFMVTLPCSSWVVIILQAFMYAFIMWVYVAANGRSFKHRTYLILGLVGFLGFFFTNILRIALEIYLLGGVYDSVYQYYLLNWQAFEEQIGMGLMFATLTILSLTSYIFFKREMKNSIVYGPHVLLQEARIDGKYCLHGINPRSNLFIREREGYTIQGQ